jgi:hypothetical protein
MLAATSAVFAEVTTGNVAGAELGESAAHSSAEPEIPDASKTAQDSAMPDSADAAQTGWMGIAPALRVPPDYLTGPGTDALAFGWPQPNTLDIAPAEESVVPAEPAEDTAPDASVDAPIVVFARADDPTDQFVPVDDISTAADIGEVAGASAFTIPMFGDAPSDATAAEETGDTAEIIAAPAAELVQEADAADPLLVFVADDVTDPELQLSAGEVALASLAALSMTGDEPAAPAEMAPEHQVIDAATADYQAQVTEEAHPDSRAPNAEQLRLVKRVRVVRRLMLNGQVVRETSAEQVVDADTDTQETAAKLQRSLASADAETLQALQSKAGTASSQAPETGTGEASTQ